MQARRPNHRGALARSLAGGALLLVQLAVPCRADEARLAHGRALYAERCALCHGAEGRGDGDAAYLLLAPPRDFRAARFRFVSTWERMPTHDDLFRAVTCGLPGSQMPSYGHLPEADRRALVAAVESLAETPWEVPASRAPAAAGASGAGVVLLPPEPPDAHTNRARAEELFRDACAPCHGASGRGDGRTDLRTVEGYPIRPRDFTRGVLKGDPSPGGVFRRIVLGIPGTPMPSNEWAYGDDGWYLAYYVLSLGPARPQAPNDPCTAAALRR